MQRIDGPTRSANLPAPLPVGTGNSAPGYFQNGDPAVGVPPTTLDVDWANAVQEEIAGVIEHAGIVLDKSDRGQLNAAIDAKIEAAVAASDEAPTIVLAVPGKRVTADGFIEIWGVASMPSNEVSFTLNFPFGGFPNECFGISAMVINTSQTNDGDTTVQEVALSRGSALLFAQNHKSPSQDSNGGVRFRAWGH